MHTLINPGIGCRPDGSRKPYVVDFMGPKGSGTIGGYETLEDAQRARDGYASTPRKNENRFEFTVRRAA